MMTQYTACSQQHQQLNLLGKAAHLKHGMSIFSLPFCTKGQTTTHILQYHNKDVQYIQ